MIGDRRILARDDAKCKLGVYSLLIGRLPGTRTGLGETELSGPLGPVGRLGESARVPLGAQEELAKIARMRRDFMTGFHHPRIGVGHALHRAAVLDRDTERNQGHEHRAGE